MTLWRSVLALVCTIGLFAACKEEKPAGPRDGGNPGENSEVEEAADIRPVYPDKPKEISPAVTKLCKALHETPRKRRAECCKTTPGIILTSECERNLAGAIEVGGVKLNEDKIDACVAAIEKQHAGCDWVAPSAQPTPPECQDLVTGLLSAKDKCRSSLECPAGMRCLGSGPTDVGRCGPPSPPRSFCNTAVDPLVTYLRQTKVEKSRPQCDGYCDRNRCVAHIAAGGACRSTVMCEVGHRCSEGKCVEGETAAAGEPCIGGDCAPGLRCSQKVCKKPGKPGDACEVNTDCLSACEGGKCKTSCQVAPLLRKLSPPPVLPGKQKSRMKKPK